MLSDSLMKTFMKAAHLLSTWLEDSITIQFKKKKKVYVGFFAVKLPLTHFLPLFLFVPGRNKAESKQIQSQFLSSSKVG